MDEWSGACKRPFQWELNALAMAASGMAVIAMAWLIYLGEVQTPPGPPAVPP